MWIDYVAGICLAKFIKFMFIFVEVHIVFKTFKTLKGWHEFKPSNFLAICEIGYHINQFWDSHLLSQTIQLLWNSIQTFQNQNLCWWNLVNDILGPSQSAYSWITKGVQMLLHMWNKVVERGIRIWAAALYQCLLMQILQCGFWIYQCEIPYPTFFTCFFKRWEVWSEEGFFTMHNLSHTHHL